jgi:hypothetical protein
LRRLGEMSPTHRISDGELGRLERFLSALRLDYRDRRYVILSVE